MPSPFPNALFLCGRPTANDVNSSFGLPAINIAAIANVVATTNILEIASYSIQIPVD